MAVNRLLYLQQMGIEACVPRDFRQVPGQGASQTTEQANERTEPPAKAETAHASNAEVHPSQQDDDPMALQWQTLENEVVGCRKCILHENRTQTVFGVGNRQAQWMFIGEAPGFEEDRQGEPFVGRAGQLLTKMLKAINFERSEVYIANVIKCRPPDNRNPRIEEIVQCFDYLRRQIQLVQPEIIILLGGVAASTLLKVQTPVSKLRGVTHHIEGTEAPVIVSYHPAYLLRSPQQKAAAWEDLKFACETVGRSLGKK